MKPGDRKNVVAYLNQAYPISITRACKVIQLPKSMYYYRSCKDDSEVITKLAELADKKPLEGQDKFYARIRLQGLPWNYKRVCRVYRMMGLNKRKRAKKRLPARVKEPLTKVETSNHTWSMDFMHDSLMNNRKFRTLNIIDDFNRKALAVEAGFSFPAESVITTLQKVIHEYGKPQRIRVDNGPEFISTVFTDWCAQNNIHVHHIQPGKPVQNGYIERFNRTFRQDVLDAYLFEDLMQVRRITEDWLDDYNNKRPHEALNNLTPEKYAESFNFEWLA